jgi:hypothetical protein
MSPSHVARYAIRLAVIVFAVTWLAGSRTATAQSAPPPPQLILHFPNDKITVTPNTYNVAYSGGGIQLTVTKYVDSASPILLRAATTGAPVKTKLLDKGRGVLVFGDAIVVSLLLNSSTEPETETVTFNLP